MRLILTLISIMLVGGCQNQIQRPNPGQACINDLPNKPEFSLIANKVALGSPTQQTFEMFSDTTKPSEKEKITIAAWVKARMECNNLLRQWFVQIKMPTQYIAIDEGVISSFMILTSDLYNGKLTYGEYAKARAELNSDRQQKLATELKAVQQHEADAEEQRKNRAMIYQLNQPKAAPIQEPTRTICNFIGNQMNCTTQ